MSKITTIVLVFFCLSSLAQSPIESYYNRKLTSDQLKTDFEIFRTGLEKIHPGLYQYNSKVYMDSLFLELSGKLDQEMDFIDFYRSICLSVAEIKCQHTVATPAEDILNMVQKEGKFLPFGTFWEFDPVSLYVTYDFSSEGNTLPGTRIISIDGRSIQEIYDILISYFPADGNILTSKHSRLMYGLELHIWYYLLIDRPETFSVKLETPQKEIIEKKYSAVTEKQLIKNYKRYSSQKNPDFQEYFEYWKRWNKKNSSKPIRLEILTENTAILTIRNFHNHKFEKIMDDAFVKLNEKQISQLIIDVRGNGGGSDIQGRYLFNYLIDEPTAYFDSLYTSTGISDTAFLFKHTDKNQEWFDKTLPLVYQFPDGRYATKPEVNEGLLLQQPKEHSFTGDVYVLMNGRSASTTAEFTAATHFNQLATFIGEESGGSYHGGNGGDFAQLQLPNSKITVQIPLSRYVMNSGQVNYIGRGTLPDFEVSRSIQDVLNGIDPQLDFVIKLIEEK